MLERAFPEPNMAWPKQPSPSAVSISYSAAAAPRRGAQAPAFSTKNGFHPKSNNASIASTADNHNNHHHNNNNKANTAKLSQKTHRKRNKKAKKNASVAPLGHTHKTSSHATGGKFAARDLYVSLRCQWKVKHQQQILHRVVMVNWDGNVVFDKPVRDLKSMKDKIAPFFKGKVIIGHGLEDCWQALGLQQHGWADVRDCAHYYPFMQPQQSSNSQRIVEKEEFLSTMEPRTLEDLAAAYFHRDITDLNDRLVAQARAAMDLYRHVRVAWENEITELLRQQFIAPHETTTTATVLEPHQGTRENLEFVHRDGFEPVVAGLPYLFQKRLDLNAQHEEELSTAAPTEATLECGDSVYSHTISDGTSSIISEPSIWASSSHSTKSKRPSAASFGWGLWLSRPATATASISCPSEWLEEEEEESQDYGLNLRKESEWPEELPEEKELLPHHLLDESFDDAEDEIPAPQEASNHPIDGSDWLEPSPKKEMSWFSRLRRSPDGRKEEPLNAVGNEIRKDGGEQPGHPLGGLVDLNVRMSNSKSSWFPRLKRSTTTSSAAENSSLTVCDPSRAD